MVTLSDLFERSVFMSGTPNDYQLKNISKQINFSVKDSVVNNYVCKPVLNVINGEGNIIENLPKIIKCCFENEQRLQAQEKKKGTDFDIRMLVNMTDINSMVSIQDELKDFYSKNNIHTVTIHSGKEINSQKVSPEIDGVSKTSEEIFTALEDIDDQKIFKGEPVILFQVDMISEGVNIKSFNSVLIQSNSATKEMQQIGRVLRNYTINKGTPNEKNKVHDGHASVYAFGSCEDYMVELLYNLSLYSLDFEGFHWGKYLDITAGTRAVNPDEEGSDGTGGFNWVDIPDTYIDRWIFNFGNKSVQAVGHNVKKLEDIFNKLSGEKLKKLENYLKGSKSGKSSTSTKVQKLSSVTQTKANVQGASKPVKAKPENIFKVLKSIRDKVMRFKKEEKDYFDYNRHDALEAAFDGNTEVAEIWEEVIAIEPGLKD